MTEDELVSETSVAPERLWRTEDGGGRDVGRRASISMLQRIRRRFEGRAREAFLASLDEVASAVSSKLSIEEVLDTVVDETKRVVGSRKAALCLVDETSDTPAIDSERMLVRGRRAELPESWWLERLEGILGEMNSFDVPHLTEDRDSDAVMLCVPVKVRGTVVGLLAAIDRRARLFTDDQVTLLAVLGAFAGVSLENARLLAQAQSSLLAGERNRIAKEMHDGLAQSLFSASLALELAKKRVAVDPEGVAESLAATQTQLSESLAELRSFIYDLRPIRLESLGLARALETKIAQVEKTSRVRGSLEIEGVEREIPDDTQACLFRVAQECAANVVKHARNARMWIRLTYEPGSVVLCVEDNGPGFAIDDAMRRADAGSSLGLRSIRDRVRAEGGHLKIASTLGEGTKVWVRLPC